MPGAADEPEKMSEEDERDGRFHSRCSQSDSTRLIRTVGILVWREEKKLCLTIPTSVR